MRLRAKQSGFSLLEILAVVAVILIIAALGIPQIIGMRNKAKNRSCDAIYHELDSEIANALDNLIWSSTEIISMVLGNHTDENNPRDKKDYAYVTDDNGIDPGNRPPGQFLNGAPPESCQVQLSSNGPLTLLLSQAQTKQDEGGGERTFRIGFNE